MTRLTGKLSFDKFEVKAKVETKVKVEIKVKVNIRITYCGVSANGFATSKTYGYSIG